MSKTYKNHNKKYSTHVTQKEQNDGSDTLITQKPKEFTTVMQNEFNNGNLNPIHTPILTQYLNIDTRFRENLYTSQSSNFTFAIPVPIRKVVSMKLASYEFPITFYGISESYGNNFLNISCRYQYPEREESVSSIIILVRDGNYSAIDLIDLINSKLRPLSTETGTLLNTSLDSSFNSIFNCIQCSLDITANGSGSGKLRIGPSDVSEFSYSNSIISIDLDFTLNKVGYGDNVSITSKLGWNLGFIQKKYIGKTSYDSDTLPDTGSMRYIYIIVNDFNNSSNNTFVGAFNNWIPNNNILARIPVNGPYFNILMENDKSQHLEPRIYFGPVDIQRIQLQVLDDHGRILDMNKSNYSICLAFKTLYD